MTQLTLGQDGSDWSRDLWPWRSWRLWLMRVVVLHPSLRPILKFVGLDVRKIWRTMCVSINGPGDLDLWPFDLETGVPVASKVGNLPSKFRYVRPLGSRIIRYVQKQRLVLPSLRGGGMMRLQPLTMVAATVMKLSEWTGNDSRIVPLNSPGGSILQWDTERNFLCLTPLSSTPTMKSWCCRHTSGNIWTTSLRKKSIQFTITFI